MRFKINYKDYLKSEHWKRVRSRIYGKKGWNNCFICFSDKNLNIHHLTYKTKKGKSNLGKEQDKDLVVLCKECHGLLHKYFGKAKNTKNQVYSIRNLYQKLKDKEKAFETYSKQQKKWKQKQKRENQTNTLEYKERQDKLLLRKLGSFNYYRLKRQGGE